MRTFARMELMENEARTRRALRGCREMLRRDGVALAALPREAA